MIIAYCLSINLLIGNDISYFFSVLVDAIEKREFTLLSLLELSAAFDAVDYEILLRRLSTTFGINSVVLRWFQSDLEERS